MNTVSSIVVFILCRSFFKITNSFF